MSVYTTLLKCVYFNRHFYKCGQSTFNLNLKLILELVVIVSERKFCSLSNPLIRFNLSSPNFQIFETLMRPSMKILPSPFAVFNFFFTVSLPEATCCQEQGFSEIGGEGA